VYRYFREGSAYADLFPNMVSVNHQKLIKLSVAVFIKPPLCTSSDREQGNRDILHNITWQELGHSPRREQHHGVMVHVKERYLAAFLSKNEKYL
jgi:hypothetical protein